MEKTIELFSLRSSGFPFDACINILGVLTEYAHIHLLRLFEWRNNTLIPTYRTLADIQIKRLTQCHVQRTDTTAHRSGQRTFNTYQILLKCFQRSLRQPFTSLLKSLSAGQHLFPFNAALAYVGQLYFDKRNHYVIGNHQFPVLHIHLIAHFSHFLKVFKAEPALNQLICISL